MRPDKRKKFFITATALFLVVLLLSVFLFQWSDGKNWLRDFAYPFVFWHDKAVPEISNSSVVKSRADLLQEIKDLKEKNASLMVHKVLNKSLRKDLYQLQKLLKLKSSAEFKIINAVVMLREPGFSSEFFVINKGSEDGIKAGSLVLTVKNLAKKVMPVAVGRIKSVSKHSSVVMSVVSKDMRLSVRLDESGATGIISGGGRRNGRLYAKITYLPKGVKFIADELVMTSGLSPYTPGGTVVGSICESEGSHILVDENIYSEADLWVAADIDKLKYVTVLSRE